MVIYAQKPSLARTRPLSFQSENIFVCELLPSKIYFFLPLISPCSNPLDLHVRVLNQLIPLTRSHLLFSIEICQVSVNQWSAYLPYSSTPLKRIHVFSQNRPILYKPLIQYNRKFLQLTMILIKLWISVSVLWGNLHKIFNKNHKHMKTTIHPHPRLLVRVWAEVSLALRATA